MRSKQDPWWLTYSTLRGFEEDDGTEEEDDGTDGNEEESEDDSENPPEPEDPTAALKSALRKERMARKKAEREARKAGSKQTQQEQQDESARAKAEREAAEAKDKTQKLAARLLKEAVNSQITRAARAAGFIDEEDAVLAISLKDIEVDQDDDDPSEIEVDFESVEEAVKALAKKKPHLLKVNEGEDTSEEEPATSKFNGRKRKGNGLTEESLKSQYPALLG